MRCFRTRCSQQGRNRDTYNDILSCFEGADVVGVMHVIHLLQDGSHAGEIVALPKTWQLLTQGISQKIILKKKKSIQNTFNNFAKIWMSALFSGNITMRGESRSMLMTVRLTLRRSRSIISWMCPLVGPCTHRRASGTNTETPTYRERALHLGKRSIVLTSLHFHNRFFFLTQIFIFQQTRLKSQLFQDVAEQSLIYHIYR